MGFAGLILTGSLLLALPAASQAGQSVGWVNALFTATSAVCVTGLTVVDTGTYWTVFGKTVIAVLIQVGGIGFMSMATLFAVLLGKQINLKERLLIRQAVGQDTLSGVVRFSLYLLAMTFALELAGTIILAFRFVPEFGVGKGLLYSAFHAISAFCNAGFDLMGNGQSLTGYVTDPLVNGVVGMLIILGGLGFTVVIELINTRNFQRMTLHTRLVLTMTLFLLVSGTILYLVLEWNNPFTLGNLPASQKIMAGFFQSLTTRTAGFNTVDTAGLTTASQLMTVILMFIGGSPGSTAGGIKTVTLSVVLVMALSVIRGQNRVCIFRKRIPDPIVIRAVTILVFAVIVLILATMTMTILEPDIPFMAVLFEVTSALGTVGLSTGITSSLGEPGKILLTATMFVGRVGTLTIGFALAKRQHNYQNRLQYPEERIIVG